MNRREALRSWGRAGLGLAALTLGGPLLGSGSPALAAPAVCASASVVPAVRPARPDERTEHLAVPFSTASPLADLNGLLEHARSLVAAELSAAHAPACFGERVPTLAERTAFLSPFEFLVAGYYSADVSTRDALLTRYREDPRRAVHDLSTIWPSPRAEALVRTPAYFDLDANQVFVNLGAVGPDDALNVVTHEFWHALADIRVERRDDGLVRRTTGFWTQVRPASAGSWRPLDEQLEGGIPTWLMNEAVAIDREVAATGRPHAGMRPDLVQALDALHEMFDTAGRDRVLQLYLESRKDELSAISYHVASAEPN